LEGIPSNVKMTLLPVVVAGSCMEPVYQTTWRHVQQDRHINTVPRHWIKHDLRIDRCAHTIMNNDPSVKSCNRRVAPLLPSQEF